ncbi:hypothetical protein HDV63DRAFT_253974 [Trichoderma sp. SZMC 28014]
MMFFFFHFFFSTSDFFSLLVLSTVCFLAASNRSRWSWWLEHFMKPSPSRPFPAKSFNEEPGSVSVVDLKRRPSVHTRTKDPVCFWLHYSIILRSAEPATRPWNRPSSVHRLD